MEYNNLPDSKDLTPKLDLRLSLCLSLPHTLSQLPKVTTMATMFVHDLRHLCTFVSEEEYFEGQMTQNHSLMTRNRSLVSVICGICEQCT
jgi:hypothetical protein